MLPATLLHSYGKEETIPTAVLKGWTAIAKAQVCASAGLVPRDYHLEV